MNQRELRARIDEFNAHTWDHTKDEFQASFDVHEPFSEDDIELFEDLVKAISLGKDDRYLAQVIQLRGALNPETLLALLRISGLTRAKPVSDMRASVLGSVTRVPGRVQGMVHNKAVWALAGPYFAERARRALEPLAAYKDRASAYEALNVATWPHWVRQERAKRQGHQPEKRAAVMLRDLGIQFQPVEKADNPLCADARFQNLSFDLVVPDERRPRVVMRSTIQTSNIGQFGESRMGDVLRAVQTLANLRAVDRPVLISLVDGVGFHSNPRGLEGVLQHADQFCQFKTLWKLAAIAADATRMHLTLALPSGHARQHQAFLNEYRKSLTVETLTDAWLKRHGAATYVPAGEGVLRAS